VKREREIEREEKLEEVVRDATFKWRGGGGGGKKHFFSGFEGSQAVPAHPSRRDIFERG
jgi:hypothetical protein